MTNAQIVFAQEQELLKAGKILGTGRMLKYELEDGTIIEYPETEPIHTFQTWKTLGFCVKKGQKSIAQFPVWKYSTKIEKGIDGKDTENTKCFLKMSCFFSMSQVEKTKAKEVQQNEV